MQHKFPFDPILPSTRFDDFSFDAHYRRVATRSLEFVDEPQAYTLQQPYPVDIVRQMRDQLSCNSEGRYCLLVLKVQIYLNVVVFAVILCFHTHTVFVRSYMYAPDSTRQANIVAFACRSSHLCHQGIHELLSNTRWV